MRYFEVSADEFGHVLYPACSTPPTGGSMQEVRLVDKTLQALEQYGTLVPMSLVEMDQQGVVAPCKLNGPSAQIGLGDAEHDMLLRQLERGIPKLPSGMARRCIALFDRVRAAPATKPEGWA